MSEEKNNLKKGAYWLIPEGLGILVDQEPIFTPEKFSQEQKMFAKMAKDFAEREVLPKIQEIDAKEDKFNLTIQLLKKAATLGLLGMEVPDKYGGLNLDFVTTILVSEMLGHTGSWAVSWGAQTGIGIHPLLFFGNEEQKNKYLPKLIRGELIAAFAATEPDAGTDLFSVKTKATLSPDDKFYILDGEKIFITNAGFANLFTVLVKIDGNKDKSACFLVERETPGFRVGQEENKMGITGSSTCSLRFDGARVPKENLLGEVGKGLQIMLNTLNLGRLKLGAMTVGPSKWIITESIRHALQRKQFGLRLVDFGLIREKLAQMIIRTWMTESAVYRTVYLIEEKLKATNLENLQEVLEALREYEVECAILKVAGSELLWFVADENLQILGGYGFIKDYPAERYQRDSRINRIFEGTNEINRLTTVLATLQKSVKNEIPLVPAVLELVKKLEEFETPEIEDLPLAQETQMVNNAKKMFLFAAGLLYQKFGHDKVNLMSQQEILGRLSDIVIKIYLAESGLLRAKQIGGEIPEAIVKVYLQEAILEIEKLTKEILASLAEGDLLKSYLGRLKRLTRYDLTNPLLLQRKIINKLIEEEKYFL